MPGHTANSRLEESNWRTTIRYFLIVFVPLLILLCGVTWVRYNTTFKGELAVIEAESTVTLDNDEKIIVDELSSVLADLNYFTIHNELQDYLNNPGRGAGDLAKEYLAFSTAHEAYDQIRYIDESGMEVVRVNYNAGEPYIVPDAELQDKSGRYYFQETITLQPGRIYVSVFDLNIEGQKIEQPLKPIIRFGAPVFDGDGNSRGIVILNYLGNNLIEKVRMVPRDIFRVMLINKDWYFLVGLDAEDEWGFMYEDGQERTFSNAFPETQRVIAQNLPDTILNDEGLFSYTRVFPALSSTWVATTPDAENPIYFGEKYWILVNYVSPDDIAALRSEIFSGIALVFGVMVVLFGITAGITARAVTRRRIADIALRQSEERYRDMANLLPQIVFEGDASGRLTFFNEAAFRLLKYDQDDIERGVNATEMILPEEQDKLQTHLQQLSAGESVEAVEYAVRRKDGSTFPVMVYFAPAARGTMSGGFRGMAVDITELKRIDRMKTEFISIASHELKSPLASIYGFIKLLQDKDTGETNETQQEFLGIIETQTNLLTSLVNDLLDVARIESGRFTLDISDVDISEVINHVTTTLQPQIQERQVSITSDYRFEGGTIQADRTRLVQVFFNLLSNAIKYNREKGSVTITVRQVEDMLQVDVADNGLGIPEGDMSSLFTKFFRAENAYKSKASGTGLGLNVTKSIIEMHGGKIWVESTEDKGSTFSFTLPLRQEEKPAAE